MRNLGAVQRQRYVAEILLNNETSVAGWTNKTRRGCERN